MFHVDYRRYGTTKDAAVEPRRPVDSRSGPPLASSGGSGWNLGHLGFVEPPGNRRASPRFAGHAAATDAQAVDMTSTVKHDCSKFSPGHEHLLR